MKTYPSIDNSSKAPRKVCHIFKKYDGSNIRIEYSKKRGWYKFGTRKCMLDENDPIFGKVVPMFLEKYADDLTSVFKNDKFFRGVDSAVVFAEFFGTKSFAGMHYPDDTNWDIVLFDVNPHKKGMLKPQIFLDSFGHLKVAELIGIQNLNDELIQSIRTEQIELASNYKIKTEIPEGVICKGESLKKGYPPWMCKIKTNRYMEELKKRYVHDWEKFWE